jgi:hypothetical protein
VISREECICHSESMKKRKRRAGRKGMTEGGLMIIIHQK